jgi:TonB-dependent receptor
LTVDYYIPGNRGLFTFGLFYKRVENAIYEFNETRNDFEFAGVVFETYESESVNNAEPGYIAGLELAFQHDWKNLPEPWGGLGFAANAAFIDSEIEVQQRPGEKLPLFNQADLLYNLTLYYDHPRFSARAGLAYQSEALFDELGSSSRDDLYRAESLRVDAQLEYRFGEAFGMYLSGRNLTDEPERTFRNGSERFIAQDPGYEIYGREFRLGLSIRYGSPGDPP